MKIQRLNTLQYKILCSVRSLIYVSSLSILKDSVGVNPFWRIGLGIKGNQKYNCLEIKILFFSSV